MEAPFTDADGARLMAALRFDADNTIAGRPMVDMLTQVAHMLDAARARAGSGALAGLIKCGARLPDPLERWSAIRFPKRSEPSSELLAPAGSHDSTQYPGSVSVSSHGANHMTLPAGVGWGTETLQQLVLVLSDGRLSEKATLRRAVREAAERAGVMLAFIILDNREPGNSVLDTKSVGLSVSMTGDMGDSFCAACLCTCCLHHRPS